MNHDILELTIQQFNNLIIYTLKNMSNNTTKM